MATAGLSYEELQMRKKLLLEGLQDTANELLNRNEVQGAMDIHHPERSPGWKPYRHQEYPKMMYHPVKLDPAIEAKRLGIRRRNEANPTYAPLDLPASEPLKIIVKDKEAEEKAKTQGYVGLPPQLTRTEEEAHAEKIAADPLAASVAPVAPSLTPEEVLELNSLPKDELAKRAKEQYGVESSKDDTKITIINAIAAQLKKGITNV